MNDPNLESQQAYATRNNEYPEFVNESREVDPDEFYERSREDD